MGALAKHLLASSWDEHFWSRVRLGDGCWEWTGAKNGHGYGSLMRNQVSLKAHRLSWVIAFGEVPDGKLVCHSCDNRACVRPSHLFVGSHSENMADMASKGRGRNRPMRGEENPNAKLTLRRVRAIRLAAKSGKSSRRDIGQRFGVTESQVGRIIRMQSWGRVA